jgi:hypothetical protein
MADGNDRVAMLSDLQALEARFDARLAEEGATTRRHFDIMVERMSELMKPIADAVGHHSQVLDGHESCLQQLEK